jgi:hypothetical protein
MCSYPFAIHVTGRKCSHSLQTIHLKCEMMPQNAHYPPCMSYCLLMTCRVNDVRFQHNIASLPTLFPFRRFCDMPPTFTGARCAGVASTFFYWDVLNHDYPLALWSSPLPFVQTYVVLFCSAECSHASCRHQDTNDDVDCTVASALIASHGMCESLQWALSMTDPTCIQCIPCTCHMWLQFPLT